MKKLALILGIILWWTVPVFAQDPTKIAVTTSDASRTIDGGVYLLRNDGPGTVMWECNTTTVSNTNSGTLLDGGTARVPSGCKKIAYKTTSGSAELRYWTFEPAAGIGWSGGGGGGSSMPNVLEVCSTCTYTTLRDAVGAINYPYGEPPEAAYQSDATITLRKITDEGWMDTLTSSAGPPAETTNTVNRVHALMKCSGTPVGNILFRACKVDDGAGSNTGFTSCASTTNITGGGLLATATVAASGISTVSLEEVTAALNATIDAPHSYPPGSPWNLVITGDATYIAGNGDFSANYCSIASYAGGTSLKEQAAGPVDLDDGEPYYGSGGASGGIFAVYIVNSDYAETDRHVVSLGPGVYELIADSLIPPNTSIVSPGRTGILSATTGTSAGSSTAAGQITRLGSARFDNISLVGSGISAPTGLIWRGEERDFNLHSNTSTSAATIVLTHSGSRGDDLVIGDVVQISQSGKPTTYYQVSALAHTNGDPGTTTITAERNIAAVYTADVARVKTWLAPKLLVQNSLVDWEFRYQANGWRGSVVELSNNDVRVPLGDFITETPSKALVITKNNRFDMRTAMGGFAATGAAISLNAAGARYESFNDSLSYAGVSPGQAAIWVRASAGTARIHDLDVRMDVSGSNDTLDVYQAAGTGSILIDRCSLNAVDGTIAAAIDNTTATVTLRDCNLASPTLTNSATLAQLTASEAFSAPVAVDGTSPDTIAVPGAQTTSVCSCGSPTAACAAPVTGIISVTPAAGSVSVAYDTGCTAGGNKTIQCKCEKAIQ